MRARPNMDLFTDNPCAAADRISEVNHFGKAESRYIAL
jgi:hypothetical protein